jgi:hypothetical protein
MGARSAVFKLLSEDLVLSGQWNIDAEAIFANADLDVAPRNGPFIVLRWEEETPAYGNIGSEVLTVWAHCPRQVSTDYVPLRAILIRVREILLGAEHVEGADGWLSCCNYNGMSADFNDEVLKTISKNAAFDVVARPTTVE